MQNKKQPDPVAALDPRPGKGDAEFPQGASRARCRAICARTWLGTVLDALSLDALCLAQIARFERPKRYEIVDALSKNNYGKVLKTERRQRLRGG